MKAAHCNATKQVYSESTPLQIKVEDPKPTGFNEGKLQPIASAGAGLKWNCNMSLCITAFSLVGSVSVHLHAGQHQNGGREKRPPLKGEGKRPVVSNKVT